MPSPCKRIAGAVLECDAGLDTPAAEMSPDRKFKPGIKKFRT